MSAERVPMRGAPLVGSAILVLLAAFVLLRLDVRTDITHFLPHGEPNERLELARELATGELTRTLVLVVDAPEADGVAALEATERFETELRAEPRVAERLAFLEGGPPAGVEEALWTLYLPRRYGFVAETPEAARDLTTDEALAAAASHLKDRLASPMSSLVSRVAPRDPTLVLPALFERLAGDAGGGLTVVDGRFATAEGSGGVLLLGTEAPATDAPVHGPLLDGIDAAFERTRAAFEESLELSMSGVHRFAVRSEQAMRADVRRVGIGSVVGLALLLALLFRSPRLLLLVLPVTGTGFLTGLAVCLALFGSVHGLTLAFGAAMIGVSIDFAIHFHCHQGMSPVPGGPGATLRRLWPALSLSAATTALGFLVLAVSDFPGLRELAVFGASGILGALAAARIWLPALAGSARPTRVGERIADALASLLVATRESRASAAGRALLAAPAGIVLALTLAGLPQLEWNDDLADLNRLDPELLAEDEAVRERVVRYEQTRLAVAVAETEDEALAINDRVAAVLEGAARDSALDGFRGLQPLLPSSERQRSVDAAFRTAPQLAARTLAALEAEGFRPEPFASFTEELAAAPPAPLRYEDLAQSALAPLVRPFRISLAADHSGAERRIGFVTFLRGVHDEDPLAAALEAIDGAHFVDVQAELGGAYGAFRARMTGLFVLGLILIVALVAARHRALRPTLIAALPAVLAGLGTVGLLSLLGIALDLLALVALLLVVGLGVDYGVLLAETVEDAHAHRATLFALVVAATSTLLGFGMLSLSDQPPLFSIGVTAVTGVSLCLVLGPTLCAALAADPERGGRA